MDTIFKTRLERFIHKTLGENAYQDVSKVVVVIMTYVEKMADSYELEPEEKKQLVLSYIQVLIPSTTQDELDGICNWIDRICEATKGMFAINQTTPSVSTSVPVSQQQTLAPNVLPAPTTAKGGSLFKAKKPSCLDTSSSSS